MAKHIFLGLHLAAAKVADEEPTPAATEGGGLNPRAVEYLNDHRKDVVQALEAEPTHFQDIRPYEGPLKGDLFYIPGSMSGSSFSGGSVEVSNYRSFMRKFEDTPGVFPIKGGHRSFGVAIRIGDMSNEILDTLEALDDYAAIDDADVSAVEEEAKAEAWEDWARSDFKAKLVEAFPDKEEEIDEMSDHQIKSIFETLLDRSGAYWSEDSGNSPFIDLDRVVNVATPEDFNVAELEPPTEPETKEASVKQADAETAEPEDPDTSALISQVESDAFTRAYVEAALWSSHDDQEHPLDANYSLSDISYDTLKKMVDNCEQFKTENEELLNDDNLTHVGQYDAAQRGGHDFWLTQNGHGAGFWDGDWVNEAGDKLTEAADKFGAMDLYVGDDGKIYS
jgi:hypothetical protein